MVNMLKISLKSARVNANLTLEEASKKIGVVKKTLWSWEKGRTFPQSKYIDVICNTYGLSYDNIIFLQKENA
jgi:DNA-binding XRE family transcriptional regulator